MRWTLPAWVTMASSLVRMEMFRRGQLDIQDLVALCILQTTLPITLTSRFRAMARWRLARLQQTPGQSPPGLMKVRTARAISWPTMDGHWLLTMARHSNWNPGPLAMGHHLPLRATPAAEVPAGRLRQNAGAQTGAPAAHPHSEPLRQETGLAQAGIGQRPQRRLRRS